MSANPNQAFNLGPIDQVGYVVEDLDRALPHYAALFGPFDVNEYALQGLVSHGTSIDCRLKIATNQSGPIEIELIQVVEGETLYSEHLRRHGEGLHHIRFRVDDVDATLAALTQAGYDTLLYKRFTPTLAFAYLATPEVQGRSVIELFESRS
jgi:methylmalonyl-CoA/ethylmalonyl-CoA epimerase